MVNPTIEVIELRTSYGYVSLTNLGASIISINVPDRNGVIENVVLSYSNVQDYLTDEYYLGATVGRVAGRIANAQFNIGTKTYQLAKNDNVINHLHGGVIGINKKLFQIENFKQENDISSVDFSYLSKDKEEGYPGNLEIKVRYIFDKNKLTIIYQTTADKLTPVNLTNHTYFNLTGKPNQAQTQELMINADHVLCTDVNYIPTGKTADVKRTPYDFTKPKSIFNDKNRLISKGYNEYFILNAAESCAVELCDKMSGRMMQMRTSYPGVLFYSGDYLDGIFNADDGICLEAQHYPDAVNHSSFPSIFSLPDKVYSNFISYEFSVNS